MRHFQYLYGYSEDLKNVEKEHLIGLIRFWLKMIEMDELEISN